MLLTRRTLMIAGAASFAAAHRPAQAAETIHFATLAGMDFVIPLLAQDLGLFKKRNLDVEVQVATQAPSILPAIIGGSLQLGVSTGVQIAISSEAGLDGVIVAGTNPISKENLSSAIVIRPDLAIRDPKDFVGKKIVVPGLNGSYHTLFLRYLKQGGVDPQQVDMIEGGFAQMPDMLRARKVDAVLSAEPFLTRMIEGGVGQRLDYFIPDRDYVFTSFFIAKRSWADTHKAELDEVRAVLREAIALTKSDPAKTNTIIADRLKLPPEVMAKQKPAEWRVEVRREDVQFWVDLAQQSGLLKGPVDVGKLLA